MDEKTAKIKVININGRYISKQIQFKIDATSMGILEVNYIIAAVNDTFVSPPIQINLEKDNSCSYMIFHLNTVLEQVNKILNKELNVEDFEELYLPSNSTFDKASMIIFEHYKEKDTLDRDQIEFAYVNEEINAIQIPIEIMGAFLETFIDILKAKDIIEEVKEEEISVEPDNETQAKDVIPGDKDTIYPVNTIIQLDDKEE